MPSLPSLLSTPRRCTIACLAFGIVVMGLFMREWDKPWKGAVARAIKQGRAFDEDEYMQIGFWWSGLGLLILLVLLLATLRWWWPWSERAEMKADPAPKTRRWEWLVVLAAVIVGAGLRVPNMTQSILWDEHDNLRRDFHGFTIVNAKPGIEPWRPAGYTQALFEDSRSNNPFLYSLLAHASLDVWRAWTGTPRDRFNVVAMRVPALLAGLGGLLTAWWCARRLGGAGAAAITIALLALHPLHIKYSVEARGYSLVLLLAPVFLTCCVAVVRRGTWRIAFATAFSAAGLLYAFPGGLYYIGAGVIGLTVALLWKSNADSLATFTRLAVSGSLVLAMLVFVMSPAMIQALKVVGEMFDKSGMRFVWLIQTWHWMTLGLHLPGDQAFWPLNAGELSWASYLIGVMKSEPLTLLCSLVIIPVLLFVGTRHWWQQDRAMRVALFITLGGPLLCLLHHGLVTQYGIYQWYMIYALPPAVVLASSAIMQMAAHRSQPWSRYALSAALPLLIVASTQLSKQGNLRGDKHWGIDHGKPTARTRMQRGLNLWETWQDGRVLRLDKLGPGVAKDAMP